MAAARHRVELELSCDSPEAARIVEAAVAHELESGPEATTVQVRREGALLRVRLEAADASSLRAALQSGLRLVDAAHRVAGT